MAKRFSACAMRRANYRHKTAVAKKSEVEETFNLYAIANGLKVLEPVSRAKPKTVKSWFWDDELQAQVYYADLLPEPCEVQFYLHLERERTQVLLGSEQARHPLLLAAYAVTRVKAWAETLRQYGFHVELNNVTGKYVVRDSRNRIVGRIEGVWA